MRAKGVREHILSIHTLVVAVVYLVSWLLHRMPTALLPTVRCRLGVGLNPAGVDFSGNASGVSDHD